jgi:hypothetical protein
MFMKKTIAVMLSLLLLSAGAESAFGAGSLPDTRAYTRAFLASRATPYIDPYNIELLRQLGLFRGTENGDELDRSLTRAEALVTVIRLSGLEEEALSQNAEAGFSDVPEWASAYVGFGLARGLARGVGDDRFGADDPITAKQYATMLLRLLGYDDAAGAFSYDAALDFAYEASLIDEWAERYYEERDAAGAAFLRGDAVCLMTGALRAPAARGAGYSTVIAKLYLEGLIDREKAAGSMRARGETEAEILRALENGYSEAWLAAVTAALDENDNIPADIKDIFRRSLYNWSKEAGSAESSANIVYSARNLKVGFASARQDPLFRVNAEIAAYFHYPDSIVIRRDLDAGSLESSVTHEFRHAMSANVGLTVLEEGITEFWNQETDGGYYGYPYYFVNLAKLLFHTAGAEAVNEGDLTGNYENLFYALEKESGVDLDNVRFYSLLADISPAVEESVTNPDAAFLEKLSEVNEVFLTLLRGYYRNNIEARVAESANHEAFADRLLALGQLLYYPSAMIREADSDDVQNAPSTYYSEDFLYFADEAIRLYGEASGADAETVLRYFEENKDRRFCLEYLGKNAGRMFVKEGTGYRVTYRIGRDLYYSDFGVKAEADRFAAIADVVGTETIAGLGFVPRIYQYSG